MALTPEQRAARSGFIGSSEAAAIVGRDPWRSSWDVWAAKTGKASERDIGPAGDLGNRLEPMLLDWAEQQLALPIVRNVMVVSGLRGANLDGLVHDAPSGQIIEAKTAGLMGRPAYLDDFGDAGTDQVPIHILLQVQHQFAVLRDLPEYRHVRLAFLPVLLGGRGLVSYSIDRNDELCDAIVEAEERFWHEHVKANVPPADSLPSMTTLRGLPRVPEKVVPLEPGPVAEWLRTKAEAAQARELEENAKLRVLTALGNAEAGEMPDGSRVTYMETARKAYTVEATRVRTLRWKGGPR